jgi:hypothetical protein
VSLVNLGKKVAGSKIQKHPRGYGQKSTDSMGICLSTSGRTGGQTGRVFVGQELKKF